MLEDLLAARRERAYEAFDASDLQTASAAFADLVRQDPQDASLHYMAGLAAKYLGCWRESLAANLAALQLESDSEGARWNAAIAATALGDWVAARAQWQALGIPIPGDAGPIEARFGPAALRLNPAAQGEVVFGSRIDPVRMVIDNVPLPESGHRFGDVVLHDGASTGRRQHGERQYLVFNALERLQPSPFRTFTVFVQARGARDVAALLEREVPGVGHAEDWTASIEMLCLKCSYGLPHDHGAARDAAGAAWATERSLEGWSSRWRGRRVLDIESKEFPLPERAHGRVWWCSPDDDGSED